MEKISTNPKLDELMNETVVVRAVDDGENVSLQAPIDDTRGPYESQIPFEHWAQGDRAQSSSSLQPKRSMGATAGTGNIKAKATQVVQGAKDKFQSVSSDLKHRMDDVKVKASQAGVQLKGKATAANQSLHENPLLFAAGAVAVGFVLGRIYMGRKNTPKRTDVSDFKDYPAQHTGVHVRHESRYASH